jgi:hypothetical protein
MAKTKPRRSIDDFKNAMLTNTKMIGTPAPELKKKQIKSPELQKTVVGTEIRIDSVTLERLNDISTREGIEVNDLIETALNHFIEMEHFFFEKD